MDESRAGRLAHARHVGRLREPGRVAWKSLTGVKPDKKAFVRPEDVLLQDSHFEPAGGLYKWDGLYYISGQNAVSGARPYHGRVSRAYVSGDFVNWEKASNIQFVRTPQSDLLGPGRSREGEQNHEGISVWNRGNLLLGVYGKWHGAEEWPGVTIDLGFVISNDGVNFREPMHEWSLITIGKDGEWDQGGLIQGQGFENVGDQTYIYYGTWDPRPVGVGPTARWGGHRDRATRPFGCAGSRHRDARRFRLHVAKTRLRLRHRTGGRSRSAPHRSFT